MSEISTATVFDANLPNLERSVRIKTFYEAVVFVRRWTIRDKDPAIKALLRRMERAHSSEAINTVLHEMKGELGRRGLLPTPALH